MKPTFRRLFILAAAAMISQPVCGQTLSQRMEAIRRQRAEAEARALEQANTEANNQRRMLQELFYAKLSVSFEKTPARDAFEFLDNALKLKLTVRYSDDAAGHGIDPDIELTLDLTDTPVIEILEMVLEQCSDLEPCTWQLRKSYIEAGTKERLAASGAQYVRMYPVSDLLVEPPMFDDAPDLDLHYVYEHTYSGIGQSFFGGAGGSFAPTTVTPLGAKNDEAKELVDLITMIVEPDAWTSLGGTWASIRYFDGVLVVRAPEFIHRQLGGYPPIPPPASADGSKTGTAGS